MYDADRFFVPNPLNRYTLSQRDKLLANADGSVDIYLQADSPGKQKEANWLHMPVDMKPGANSVTLEPQNGSISH